MKASLSFYSVKKGKNGTTSLSQWKAKMYVIIEAYKITIYLFFVSRDQNISELGMLGLE
jgi:hypothetical protein